MAKKRQFRVLLGVFIIIAGLATFGLAQAQDAEVAKVDRPSMYKIYWTTLADSDVLTRIETNVADFARQVDVVGVTWVQSTTNTARGAILTAVIEYKE